MAILKRITWFLLLPAGCGAWAQALQNRMDISWMAGGVSTSATQVPGTNASISGSSGWGMQINYGYRIRAWTGSSLWIETPQTFTWEGTGTISGATVTALNRNVWYFTPGVRLRSRPLGRVSFYGALGGGFGSFGRLDSIVSGASGIVTANSTTLFRPVFDFGAGMDLRVSRLVSIRAEGRDFVSGSNLGGVAGHNHPLGLIGLSLHF